MVRLLLEWAAHGFRTTIQDVGIDHGGLHILVPEQFLHGPNIVAGFQQLRGEAVPEGISTLLIIRRSSVFAITTIPSLAKRSKSSGGYGVRPRIVWSSNSRMAWSWLCPRGCLIQ